MRVVVQRVTKAQVSVEGNVIGKIKEGLLILLGITHGDNEKDTKWLVNKISGLRIFSDGNGKMNKSIEDIEGEILLISQFTLYGDARKGRRPSFIEAAKPDIAVPLYNKFIDLVKEKNIKISVGEFGADMKVELLNDGPVTMIIDSPEK
ncbi:D-aminoacyl-tRNA deacylase [Ilyobacter polytropus]|uniref:D-aminoacyl-tRNA deacylase n=1 Tax=Ilyobacter polytropus (strain ATCC 51220 / DSM 2926 / LMG 16218 / CuHBu1) TaxID=572544 RepID=E3HDF3_ILYPC|nr:D-aminoacyl-tRNA deacylase [Ilyobacter polytropus]ADO84556.1 D-tyrosyl-tRNA(Tyr) deacylase [Ilyobacter polytropus DSM 2926]